MQTVTLVAHRPGWVEQPWVRSLLGPWVGDVVDDPERKVVLPDSIVVSDRPDLLRNKYLAAVRRHGTVGLLHISDHHYRCGLEAYRSFGFVWRTYYHSGLSDWAVRQLPLGPELVADVSIEPTPAALRPPGGRLYTWSFVGSLAGRRAGMIEAFRLVDGGQEHSTAASSGPDSPWPDPAAVLELLGESVFVPCAAEGVQLESSRIYEALEMGAIPIVERRRRFDYFRELFGEHPLPTVRSWAEAPALVRGLLADQRRLTLLHERMVSWWAEAKAALSYGMRDDIEQCFAASLRGVERSSIALDRPAPRWRGQVEMLRHRGLRAQ
ncbi:MAG: hypothetical protein ACRD2C_08155 [Acidimicrobiales bacterium]